MERRGRSAATQPEVFYSIMEDRVLPTERGILEFPAITVIGTTTDEGLLPDSFIDRFPLRPRLVPYTEDDLKEIVHANASALDLRITYGAIDVFADACRGVPRQINNFVKNAVTNMRRSYRRYEQGDARRNREAEQQREDYLARTQAIENCASALYEIAYRR
jgi:Holliday junction resolvasome RuvABC ATP-dependent DNA helicase subunit